MSMKTAAVVLLACVVGAQAAHVGAQNPSSRWDTTSELLEWAAPINPKTLIELREEAGRAYVRLSPASGAILAMPKDLSQVSAYELGTMPAAMDPRTYNAVSLTLRHTMNVNEIGGYWFHRNGDYDESMWNVPFFSPQPAPGDGEWHDLTFRLTDAPFVDFTQDIVFIAFLPALPRNRPLEASEELAARLGVMPPSAYLDVDRIEFVHVPDHTKIPAIAEVAPRKGRVESVVTITGSGFAVPASRNVVVFDDVEADILSGDSTSLLVRAPVLGVSTIWVHTPGGHAVAAGEFVGVGRPEALRIVGGGEQVGRAGATTAPLVVALSDGERGVPGETVRFQVVEGSAVVAATETTTDEDGRAATVVTLGTSPGPVRVAARALGFRPVFFRLTALP